MNGNMNEDEHEVYGAEIPDINDIPDISDTEPDYVKELAELRMKLEKAEEEAAVLREKQAKFEKQTVAAEDPPRELTQEEKEDADNRSIFVSNVHFACTVDQVQAYFQKCGIINRTTLILDKFGKPKGIAYVEFADVEGVDKALELNDSVFRERPLKVLPKRTNVPGVKHTPRYRRRRPQYYSPYGYGKVPRFRGPPMWYMPY